MISQPSCYRLIEIIRAELAAVIPAVADPQIKTNLGMMDSVLRSISIRCQHEIAWMVEEIDAIQRSAENFVALDVNGSDRVKEALVALRAEDASSLHFNELQQRYALASEVLSCLIEAALLMGGSIQLEIEGLLDGRLAREVEIRGEFSLVARS